MSRNHGNGLYIELKMQFGLLAPQGPSIHKVFLTVSNYVNYLPELTLKYFMPE